MFTFLVTGFSASFWFFLLILLRETGKHCAMMRPENSCMKPKSTETHFDYIFHFSGFSCLASCRNTSTKSLKFFFGFALSLFLCSASKLSFLFAFSIKSSGKNTHPKTFDFTIRFFLRPEYRAISFEIATSIRVSKHYYITIIMFSKYPFKDLLQTNTPIMQRAPSTRKKRKKKRWKVTELR